MPEDLLRVSEKLKMLIGIICVFYFSLLSFSKEMYSLVVRIHNTVKTLDWIPGTGLFVSVKIHTVPLLEVNKIQLTCRSSFQKVRQATF